jgi:hypothetical protein
MEQQQQQQQPQQQQPPTASSVSSNSNRFQQRKEQMMQTINRKMQPEQVAQRRQQMRQGLQSVGKKLQTLNPSKLIDQMEQDQGLADQLEQLNVHIKDEKERHNIKREAEAACMQSIQEHLDEFLEAQQPDGGTYEQWIEDLHPENAHDGQLLMDMDKEIDLRFYVLESDHRQLWNDHHLDNPLRQVAARTRMWSDQEPVVDLLSTHFVSAVAEEPTAKVGVEEEQAPPQTTEVVVDLISF